MTLIIHDLNDEDLKALKLPEGDVTVVRADGRYAPCRGCFKCWLKNVGHCEIADDVQHFGALLGASSKVVIISENLYGGFSVNVKKLLERGISISLPFFTYRAGRVHHMLRYPAQALLKVYFYGEMTELEREAARQLISANSANMGFKREEVVFAASAQGIAEVTA